MEISNNILKEEYAKRIDKNVEDVNINSAYFKLFVSLNIVGIQSYDVCFALAQEIICNRGAIRSLDNHVIKLMDEVRVLRKLINESKKNDNCSVKEIEKNTDTKQ